MTEQHPRLPHTCVQCMPCAITILGNWELEQEGAGPGGMARTTDKLATGGGKRRVDTHKHSDAFIGGLGDWNRCMDWHNLGGRGQFDAYKVLAMLVCGPLRRRAYALPPTETMTVGPQQQHHSNGNALSTSG